MNKTTATKFGKQRKSDHVIVYEFPMRGTFTVCIVRDGRCSSVYSATRPTAQRALDACLNATGYTGISLPASDGPFWVRVCS